MTNDRHTDEDEEKKEEDGPGWDGHRTPPGPSNPKAARRGSRDLGAGLERKGKDSRRPGGVRGKGFGRSGEI
eukprot:7222300-Pyramimonas_sp.AAC.1